MKQTINCAICGSPFKRITRTHLKKHDITTAEYVSIFPDHPIVSEELAHQLGKASREMSEERRAEVGRHLGDLMRGVPKTDEHRAKISQCRSGVSWGQHTEEHKEKMRLISAASMEKRKSEGWTFHVHTEEEREKMSVAVKAARAIKFWRGGHCNKGRKLNLTPEQRERRSINSARNMNGKAMVNSSLEMKMRDHLDSLGIAYEQQKMLVWRGAWVYDFFIPSLNLLLEVDGEYWHNRSLKIINRDEVKEKVARKQGFRFVRISEFDWCPEIIHADDEDQRRHNTLLIEKRKAGLDSA